MKEAQAPKLNCWEVRGCDQGPDSPEPCAAVIDSASNGVNGGINAGRLCWAVVGTLFGYHLAWMDVAFMRDLAGLPVSVSFPLRPIGAGWLVLIALTLLAAVPATVGLLRSQPSAMLSTGRNE